MQFVPTPAAYKLLHEGALALSEIESNGMRVDRDYLAHSIQEIDGEIKELESVLRLDPIYKKWVQRFGDKANLTSADQLSQLMFGTLGYKPRIITATGDRISASEAAMAHIDLPFVKTYFQAAKLRKALGTYLRGIWREMVQHADGCWYVHPSFNLHTVETFRSSCSEPNVQNIPNRNPRIAEIVRRCYIARPGHQILELDYGQIEVRIPCAYHSDPTLMEYVFDPSKDMHRDTAAQIFLLSEKQAKQKNLRHYAKNQFVFPTFYGSIAQNIAPFIWELLERDKPTIDGAVGADGKPLLVMDHLASKGIKRLGACDLKQSAEPSTFEHHLIQIEKDFWERRFKVYSQWKRDWYQAYLKNGGCRFLTGFVMKGVHAKNDVTNYPVQGAAFHCTLWAMPRIQRRLKKYKFKTRMINEVHDSIQFDCWPPERDDVIDMSIHVMTEAIKKWATWLNVPLVVEPEACPIEGSWFDKHVLVRTGDGWVPADLAKWEKKHGAWE